jgi:hypothetical protein
MLEGGTGRNGLIEPFRLDGSFGVAGLVRPHWLRYELFRGRLSDAEFLGSEAGLLDFIRTRGNTKPHLMALAQ